MGLVLGTIIGMRMALKVQMTAMPQMVSFFNGMGGACAAVISLVEFDHLSHGTGIELGMIIVIVGINYRISFFRKYDCLWQIGR